MLWCVDVCQNYSLFNNKQNVGRKKMYGGRHQQQQKNTASSTNNVIGLIARGTRTNLLPGMNANINWLCESKASTSTRYSSVNSLFFHICLYFIIPLLFFFLLLSLAFVICRYSPRYGLLHTHRMRLAHSFFFSSCHFIHLNYVTEHIFPEYKLLWQITF